MKIIDLSDIYNNIEDFVLAKIDIDNIRIANKEITKKTTIQEFIIYLQNQLMFYINDNDSLGFKYISTTNDLYFIYVNTCPPEKTKKYINYIIDTFSNIEYDITKLTKLSSTELAGEDNIPPYFIINNKYYIYRK